jgi:hypothetical protein
MRGTPGAPSGAMELGLDLGRGGGVFGHHEADQNSFSSERKHGRTVGDGQADATRRLVHVECSSRSAASHARVQVGVMALQNCERSQSPERKRARDICDAPRGERVALANGPGPGGEHHAAARRRGKRDVRRCYGYRIGCPRNLAASHGRERRRRGVRRSRAKGKKESRLGARHRVIGPGLSLSSFLATTTSHSPCIGCSASVPVFACLVHLPFARCRTSSRLILCPPNLSLRKPQRRCLRCSTRSSRAPQAILFTLPTPLCSRRVAY